MRFSLIVLMLLSVDVFQACIIQRYHRLVESQQETIRASIKSKSIGGPNALRRNRTDKERQPGDNP